MENTESFGMTVPGGYLGNEIRRLAAREFLDMYIEFYGEEADEKFMQRVSFTFSY